MSRRLYSAVSKNSFTASRFGPDRPRDGGPPGLAHGNIEHAVAGCLDDARSSGHDDDAAAHLDQGWIAYVGAVMTVIGKVPATKITSAGTGILVDIVLHEANSAHRAIDGKLEMD